MLVKEMMTKNITTISPDTSLKEAGKILKEKRISGIPVVDNTGDIVGIITVTDILRLLEQIYQWQALERKATGLHISDLLGKAELNTKVEKIMTKTVFTLDEDKDINEVMQLMFTKKIHTIPITKNGKLVGIIGKRDLIVASF